jgi:hypothetical protein
MAVDAAAARVRIAAHRPVDVEVGTERLTLAAGEVRELHAASTLSLRVGDLVDVQVTPGGSEIVTLQRKAAEAAQALRSGLSKLGLESVARARAVVEERRTLAAEATAADKVLATIAPDGLFALTRELALSASRQAALQSELLRHSQPDDPALERDAAAAEQSVRDAEATHQAATRAFESAQKAATSHEVARAKLETDAQLAVERVHDAERERDAMGARLRADEQAFGADDVLAQARSAAMERWLEAGRAVETLDASIASVAPDLIDQRAQRTEKAWADAQRELKDTSHQIAEVRGRLQAGDLVGLHERLGRARARNMAADREHARIADRAAAVKLLREVMHDARNTTRRAFLSPLRREVEPLLQVLFDRSALEFDDDFAIREVARGGHGVDTFDKLGGGSREQLEIIVRLAMARVLAGGETLPVMLDDAIVYTSRDRFDRMASVMSLAARSLQVILFTCHWERYRTIGVDHAIDLERLRRDSRP